jgi:putative ABC transport system permease protein
VNPDAIPRMQEIRVDATVAVVTLAIALTTGMLFGLAPAMQLVRTNLQSTLKEGTRGGSESGERHRLGRALVSGEIALAVVVVIGAALLVRSFWALRSSDPGFRPDHVLVIDLAVPASRYDEQATTTFYQRLVERAGALPGVQVAAAASDLPPFASGKNWDVEIDGRPRAPGESAPSPNVRAVTAGYFRAMSIGVVRGRALGPEDTRNALPTAVVNEAAARAIWAGGDPIGQRVRFDRQLPWITIVGVARDVHSMGLAEPAPAEIFLPHEQLPSVAGGTERAMYVVLRTSGDPTALAAPARALVRELDPLLAIVSIRSMVELMDLAVAQPRFTVLLLGVFGGVALALAAIGIYGVLSYAVKRRTREIGIRIALGGEPRHVVRLVVGQGMRLALLGLAVGVLGAFLATRLMTRLLYGVSATDPLTFVAITVLLALVALVASWLPARRAVRTDPRAALAAE